MAAKHAGLLLAFLVMTQHVAPAAAQTAPRTGVAAEAVRYSVSFTAPHTHYMDVSAVVPTGGRQQVELMMAVWTPGSYLVREFSRHVEDVSASAPDGRTLAVE